MAEILIRLLGRGPAGPMGPAGPAGADGRDGRDGLDGKDGADGAAGPGVAAGGSAGQLLRKKSAADYDTEWVEAESLFPDGDGVSY